MRDGRVAMVAVLFIANGLVAQPAVGQQGGEVNVSTPAASWPINVETAPRPVARAVRATGRITVDGRLNEPAWQDASPLSAFVQAQPRVGHPASERTVVRLLYDDRRLYIAAVCYDSQPDHLTVLSLEQDFPGGSTRDSDIFGVTLDPFLDRQSSFMFLINPRGAYRDGQTFNDSRQEDFAWRAVVDIKTTVHDSGWTVEMAIPWTTLRFDPTKQVQTWGMNLLRRIRRKNEDALWAPEDRKDPVHRMSKAGTLVGIRDIHAGRNLTIKPFVLANDESGSLVPEGGGHADAGGDAKWGITSGLTLDLTVRTDFSQADVDQERVNLTRFPLFFPEKRDFFVENSGSFLLGDVVERNLRTGTSLRDFTLFHSRRIGLTDDGRLVPIIGGARLTGRAAGLEIGLLDMQTQALDSAAAENFSVVRVRRNLGASDIGFMAVNRQGVGAGAGGAYNRSYGADANLHLLGHLALNSYLAGSDEPGVAGDRAAARLAVGWRDRVWDASAFVRHVGAAFDPGAGFVSRTGIDHRYATVGAHPRPFPRLLQETNPYVEVSYITDSERSVLETREGTLGVSTQFRDGSVLNTEYTNRFERIVAPFTVSGVTIPASDYSFDETRVSYQSSQGRSLNGSLSLGTGGYFAGTRRSVAATGQWRVNYHIILEGSASHNAVRLPQGDFNADAFAGRARLAYSTTLFGSAFIQYNGQTDQLVTNVRLNWIYAPLSDVFLVYQERRDVTRGLVLDRVVTAKVTRLLAF